MKLSSKQAEYIRKSQSRLNFKIGAVRSGKSFVDIVYTIPRRVMNVSGKDGLNLILGVSKETIERNVLQPMRERYTDKLIGTINNRNIAKICGEDVYCIGAEKYSQLAKIQGMSVKYLYGDEIAKWNEDVFMMALSRLDKGYSKMDGACNPESPNHWLKKFLDNEELDTYIQRYTIWDNPFLPKEFIDNLCHEYEGTVYYGRYIEGNWTLAEGLCFPRYEDALVDKVPKTTVKEYCVSLDYGTSNPFAGIFWEKHDGVWYAVKELYYSGRDTGIQKTDGDYLEMLIDFAEPALTHYEQNKSMGVFGGGYVEKLQVIIDPSAASMIALLNKSGKFRVIDADNSVKEGIANTNLAIQRGNVKISKKCENGIDEMAGYVWDENSEEDRPVKVNDHFCDALRYFCQTKGLAEQQEEYTSIFRRRI